MMRPTVHLMSLQLYFWWFVALSYMGSAGFSVWNVKWRLTKCQYRKRNDCFGQLQWACDLSNTPTKTGLGSLLPPAHCKRFKKKKHLSKASLSAYVTSATKNMVDTEAVTQISPWKWWWAFCVTLEDSPPSFTAQQLSSPLCQSYLSPFFSPFFSWNSAADEGGIPMLFTSW